MVAAPLNVYTVSLFQLFLQEWEDPGPQSPSTSCIVLLHLNELSWKLHAAADCSASVYGLGLALPTRLEKSFSNWSVKSVSQIYAFSVSASIYLQDIKHFI